MINGRSLAPYPGSYYGKYLTSDNGCGGGGGGTYWVDTFADATGYAAANTADARFRSWPRHRGAGASPRSGAKPVDQRPRRLAPWMYGPDGGRSAGRAS